MVYFLEDIRTVDLNDLDDISDDCYLFLEWEHCGTINNKIVDKDMSIGVYDGVLYVFNSSAERIFVKKIDSITKSFSFKIIE